MSSSPNDLERSLLQKAVRRGNADLVGKVFAYLYHVGDGEWLRNRLAVIAYEECWTYADHLLYPKQPYKLVEEYKTLARTIKNKNAAGLATLAMRVSEGESSALVGSEKDKTTIQTVANAVKNQEEFWKWIKSEPEYLENANRIDAAERDIEKANFPGDKVMMMAAAYLALRYPIPETEFTAPNNDTDFPYWIAIDKHTAQGKIIYSEAYNETGVLPTRAMKIGFYLEGAAVNQLNNSPFWDLAKEWEINNMKYSMSEAEAEWEKLKPVIMEMAEPEVNSMLNRINNFRMDSDQLQFEFW